MKTKKQASSDRLAFTLIELLIVMAVMAILSALLLPVLASAKDKAQRTQCINNQRQMALVRQMYADDNSDWLAPPNWDNGNAFNPGWLYSGLVPNISLPPWANNLEKAYATGLWFRYMPNIKSYLCPVDVQSPYYNQRKNKMSSYVMNGAVCGYSNVVASCKQTQIWSPMCYLMWEPDENNLGPGNPGPYDFNDASDYPNETEGVGLLHSKKGGVIVAIDGHVEFIQRSQFRNEADTPSGLGSGPGGRTFLWWNPYSADGH